LVTKKANISRKLTGVSRSGYAVFRHFHFGDSPEGEKQFDQIFRGSLGSLAHNVADRGGYGRVEQNASGLQSGEIHAHCLSRLKGSHDSPRTELWAYRPPIANQRGRFAEFRGGPGILPAIFQPSTRCKNAGGTPAPRNPAQLQAETSQKLSDSHNSAYIVTLFGAG
jgi:hypothetical protein